MLGPEADRPSASDADPEERMPDMSGTARGTDPIGELVSPAVATIGPTATLRQAVDAMVADGLGLLVVTDANGPTGVLSERDIVVALSEDLGIDEERVRDHCSSEIVGVDVDASVEDAARAMADAQIRHLAVTRDGAVVGVVSVRDVLRALVAG
jgi:CBS domain-containing protein